MTRLTPPPLSNDCFALPPGVDWIPVDTALAHLKSSLTCIAAAETVPLQEASGRILAADVRAQRANPPAANAAVDGYGFAHASLGSAPHQLPLCAGRAAAGAPFVGQVPAGEALRILTGAILPDGVDSVVLEEDTRTDGTAIAFNGPVKAGANARKAGEDFNTGEPLLPEGHLLRAPDLALLAAAGHATVNVRVPLRVGVLSTGDELCAPGEAAALHQIADANGPMLQALSAGWGFDVVPLGRAPDERDTLREMLNAAAQSCDAILTSGGASAGDEDHLSALLTGEGTQTLWRVAMKPGRPLALGMWNGCPVFGLPGNPVAAFVTALIFARPALAQLAGAGWRRPVAFTVPAAFEKKKKPGRKEYLRARYEIGRVEVFKSEGSGRISGLSWANGLVELPHEAVSVIEGDVVRFLPYDGFFRL